MISPPILYHMTRPAQDQKSPALQIFQVFTGRWESANIRDHNHQVFKVLSSMPFEHLQSIGINTIYLLGVFENNGPLIVDQEEGENVSQRKDRCPSVFAISNHQATNSQLGSIEELQELIKTLQNKGFKVIVDFIPNHTSTTHPWVVEHPYYYYQLHGEYVREFSGDVYKLDYNLQAVRSEMRAIVETIASWGVDGVRCDMAHLIPADFWRNTITAVKAKHNQFMFIGESYETSVFEWVNTTTLIEAGFDYIYHHALYENIKMVVGQGSKAEGFLESHVDFMAKHSDLSSHLLNYVANHDDRFPGSLEQLYAMLEKIKKPNEAWLYYNGILNGHLNRLAHHYLDILPDKDNELWHIPEKAKVVLNAKKDSYVLTLDIGGSKIESALVDKHYQTHKQAKVPTENGDYTKFIAQLTSIIKSYADQNIVITGIALAVPGILNQKGEIVFAGGNLHFLNQKNIKEALEKEHNLPIIIENDSNCFALGEALYGAGMGHSTVVGITWGTGIGSGIVIDQKLFRGSGGAGEIGHIPVTTTNQSILCGCGKANCLEVYAGGASIQKQYRELGGKIPEAKVIDIVNSDEVIAIAVIDQAVIFLAEAIVAVINLLSPDCIVLGGGISQIDARVFKKLEKLIATQEIRSINQAKIVKHALANAALVGAAVLWRNAYD